MARYVDASSLYVANTCFNGQSSISSVDLKNTAWQNNSMVNAFRDCGNLTSISNISNTVTDMSGAFAGSGISSITIPDGVTDLGSPHTVVTNLYGYDLPEDEWFVNSVGHVYLDTPYVTNSSRMVARDNITNVLSTEFTRYYYVERINSTFFKISGSYNATRNSAMDLVNAEVSGLIVGAFEGCCNLVTAPIIPNSVTNCYHTFYNCSNLKECTTLPNCHNLEQTFYNCKNLIVANIPDTVTNMLGTFENCRNLTKVSDIPSSVTMLYKTFINCTSMRETPNISEGVSVCQYTFENCTNLIKCRPLPESATLTMNVYWGCTNLVELPPVPRNSTLQRGMYTRCSNVVTAPIIPQNVNDVSFCFTRCTNLTGDVLILSNEVTNAASFVYGSSLTKNVYIPFTYDNGVNTATYNAFINAGYTTTGSVNGVYLKDLDTYMSTHNFTYTTSGTNVTLTNYTGSSNTVTIPYTFKGE